jgi:DNA processing protein
MGKDVAAIPGDITRPSSVGTNELLKHGATLLTNAMDAAHILGIELAQKVRPHSDNPDEQCILDLLSDGIRDGAELLVRSTLNVAPFNQALTMLEIRGVIRPLGNNQWNLA